MAVKSSARTDEIVLRAPREILPDGSKRAVSLAIVAAGDATFASAVVAKFISSCARDLKRVVVADLAHGILGRQLGTRDPGVIR